MTDFPATQPSWVQLNDDPGGDAYEASQVNTIYDEVEAIAAHQGAGKTVCANGGVLQTLAESGSTVGYAVGAAADDVDGTPVVLIPGGTYDVTAIVGFMGIVNPSSGTPEFGFNFAVPGGDSVTLFDDGTNTCTLSVSAGGEVSVVRGAGTITFDVVLSFIWI